VTLNSVRPSDGENTGKRLKSGSYRASGSKDPDPLVASPINLTIEAVGLPNGPVLVFLKHFDAVLTSPF
jgi:hypothetical protein